jgi:hypothetical protein
MIIELLRHGFGNSDLVAIFWAVFAATAGYALSSEIVVESL